jgi:protein-L-isoaspartate(D-aspartate) O-methyltransferase
MPRLFISADDSSYVPLDGHDDREGWLANVYQNDMCVTQLDGDNAVWDIAIARGSVHGIPTCTSTEPGLMAWMLDDLGIDDGCRVMEIGTGTGYNAALLCERLGAGNVTSIDVDPALVVEARSRLAVLGYHPLVVSADGRDGYAENAPYDAIIATCSLPRVPAPWVDQLKPGGRIIANVSGTLGGAMLLIRRSDSGHGACGQFIERFAGFLPARGALGVGDITPRDTDDGAYETGVTSLSPEVLDMRAFAFLAWLATQDARLYWADLDDGRRLTCLIGMDGSWCEVYPEDGGKRQVDQGGPRRLWSMIEQAYQFWIEHERPDWSSFGVTIDGDEQPVWFETPSQITPWRLPSE